LTLARTEAQRFQSVANDQAQQAGGTGGANSILNGSAQSQGEMSAAPTQADLQKQGQQIADLVSDIRHLQLDLEYHQQKLDQMIEEKQQMLKDEKKMKMELAEAKKQVEEREQLIRHRDVDIQSLRDEAARWGGAGASGGGAGGGFSGADAEATVSALRSEAAAKDSALIVSHYELHKEKLMRDRLEQKNLKLMDRMQKLMMVVETMRKDNVALERNLTSKERAFEEKDLQLRQVSQKSKQWQKQARSAQGRQKPVSLELEATPSQGLPLLGASQDALRSGRSTPTRTPRGGAPPQSPYGSR
jgi:chromosome segregation ATPase